MATPVLVPVSGVIQSISPMQGQCCNQRLSLLTPNGIVNFIISPDTYIVQDVRLRTGMQVAAFYDSNLPVPLIFPPQYQAAVITQRRQNENVLIDFFDQTLTASSNALRLNLSPATEIVTSNGQRFTCNVRNQTLLVYYTATTRSIPPQTTPRKIIVLC